MKNRELNRAILRKVKEMFSDNIEVMLYFLIFITMIAVLYFGYLAERSYTNPETTITPHFLDVQNEPESEILDRVYYYDSLDSAYL